MRQFFNQSLCSIGSVIFANIAVKSLFILSTCSFDRGDATDTLIGNILRSFINPISLDVKQVLRSFIILLGRLYFSKYFFKAYMTSFVPGYFTEYNFVNFVNASMTTRICFLFDFIDGSSP